MFRNIPFERVNWFDSLFLTTTFFVTLIGVPIYIMKFGLDPIFVAMFLFYFVVSAMGITVGYHRLFAHRAFKAKAPVKLATLIFGSCAFEHSALNWCSDHRDHHKFTDDDHDDPYSISRGFFWAHMGWIFFKLRPRELPNVADLRKDKLVMWQHKYYHWIGITVGFVIPTLLGYWHSGWTGALGGLLFGGIASVVAVQHCTFFINSLCHTLGRQPYDSKASARDSPLMALFTFGEGYHNYHHAFQHDYRNGVKPWQWDPTKWTIWTLSKLGLTGNLREVSPEKILLAELKETNKRAEERLQLFEAGKEQGSLGGCEVLEAAIDELYTLQSNLQGCREDIEAAVAEQISASKSVLQQSRLSGRHVLRQLTAIEKLAS